MWTPGIEKLIRAGSDLVLQIHYTPNGKEAEDQIEIGPVSQRDAHRTRGWLCRPESQLQDSAGFPNGATILGLLTHMHLSGKALTA
jgi:hypothetical protein